MKRFPVLITLTLVLGLTACGNQKVHQTIPADAVTASTAGNQYDRLLLPDGSTITLGDRIDGRFNPLQAGQYQLKSAFAASVLAPAGTVVGIVSVKTHGGTIEGFAYGTNATDLNAGFVPATFGGRPAFAKSFAGGTFYAVQDGCPAEGLNLVAIVADGYKAPLEATVQLQPCDPAHERD